MSQSVLKRTLYGRQKGHALTPRKAALMQEILPAVAVPLERPFCLDHVFQPSVSSLRLEIGFGGGEHLIAQAQHFPACGFIGCEPFMNGVAKAITDIHEKGLNNVRLYRGDARDVLAWLPDACVQRIDILYPDPWPKKRHHKRRIINSTTLPEFARVLKPQGELRFATDIPDYVLWTQELIASTTASFLPSAHNCHVPWEGWFSTRYEQKALREGRTPAYFIYKRR